MKRLLALSLLVVGMIAITAAPAAARGFNYGVAAGEVTSSSAVLWARAGGPGRVVLYVARDRRLRRGRNAYRLTARRSNDNTVQRRVRGLRSSRRYYFRFRRRGGGSAVGTFTTAPRASSKRTIEFGWTGDYDAQPAPGQTRPFWNNFGVFKSMQRERNHFNIALGDTIYTDSEVPGVRDKDALTVRQKWGKYRQNLSQRKLARLRGSAGFYSHWDDHEFYNDFSRPESRFETGSGADERSVTINGERLYRRGARAFRDYAPVSYSKRNGLYRTRRWGRNLALFFLDERSFRSAKASAGGICDNPQTGDPDFAPTAPQGRRTFFSLLVPSLSAPVSQACKDRIADPKRSYLGTRQRERFLHEVKRSKARFKVVMNELPIQQLYVSPYDRWEGYEADRQRVLRGLRGVKNVIFLTTDVHATYVNDARFKTLEPGGPVNSGILDVTVGPAATATAGLEIDKETGRAGNGRLADDLFLEPQPPNGVGMRCSGVSQFGYGQVKVTSRRLTVTPKGIDGKPLRTDDGACGPFVLDYRR